MEAASTANASPCVPSCGRSATEATTYWTTSDEATAPGNHWSAANEASATVVAAPVKATSAVAAEPRAGAEKDASGEPARAIVAVRCARVWGIGVVSVGACGSGTNIARAADSNADRNSLGVCVRC